jgi:hypothetical protein
VTKGETKTKSKSSSTARSDEKLERAKVALEQGLEAKEPRARRPIARPVLWGIAVLGGAVGAVALFSLAQRRSRERPLLQVTFPPWRAQTVLPVLGVALAQLALRHSIEKVSDNGQAQEEQGGAEGGVASAVLGALSAALRAARAPQGPAIRGTLAPLV